MEEFKETTEYLLKTPLNLTNDVDLKLSLTTLKELLQKISPSTAANFYECLQTTLRLIPENINTSDVKTTCSLDILNYVLSNNYHVELPATLFLEIFSKLSSVHCKEVWSKYYQNIISMIVKHLQNENNEQIALALKCVETLAKSESDPNLIRTYLIADELIIKLLPFLFDDDKQLRSTTINIVMSLTSSTVSFTTITVIHIQTLKNGLLDDNLKYVKKIENLLVANDEHWHQIWRCVVRLLGLELHRGGPLYVNALLEILEEAFKSSMNATRICAFQCWQELILNFSIDIEELCTKKRIKLLLIPLKASNCKAELVALEKFKTWWLLLNKMGPSLQNFIDDALIPFLNFCFAPLPPTSFSSHHNAQKREDNLYLGRRFPALLPHIIDALLQIIGHKRKSCTCVKRIPVEFIILQRDNLVPVSKVIMRAVKEATILISRTSVEAMKSLKILECLWHSLMQIIRKDDTQGIREEFITNVNETIDMLLAKNNCDIAAVIFEETILEKTWLFLSLDHEIQYVQNMADKRKLIFSIRKPVVLQNFIQVLLDGGGDGSKDMVKNILFNVNYLLAMSETEVYNFLLMVKSIVVRVPRIIQEFLRTPIEYVMRCPSYNTANWVALYEKFFNENVDYPPETVVEFCVYLESIRSHHVLVGSVVNVCIPKLNVMSVPNVCIEKVLKTLHRLVEHLEECHVFNSLNKLLKLFYKNYGAISIIFKSLPQFLKHHKQQNYDDFFYVLSTIGDIIAKVSTDTFLLTLILTSLRNFEASDDEPEVNAQIQALIKKCKQKLKPELKTDKKPDQNRAAKMVAMSTEAAESDGGVEATIRVREPKSINDSCGSVDATVVLGHNIDTMTPTVPRTSFLARLPPPEDAAKSKFVVINSTWKFNPENMSEKQKEKMKARGKDLPALYADLSQSNSQDLFTNIKNKEFIADENVKENVISENVTFPDAFTKPTPTAPVEGDKRRTRRRTITRVQRNKTVDATATSSENNENVPETNDVEPTKPVEDGPSAKLSSKAERELRKLQINGTKNLALGATESKTLRSRDLGAADNKWRRRRKMTKGSQEASQEDSMEVIESSQDSPSIKISKPANRSIRTQTTSEANCEPEAPSPEETRKETSPKVSSPKQIEIKIQKLDISVEEGSTVNLKGKITSPRGEHSPGKSPKAKKTKTEETVPKENSPSTSAGRPERAENQENVAATENLDSKVNKLHSIIENNYNMQERMLIDKEIAKMATETEPKPTENQPKITELPEEVSDSIPTTAEAVSLAEQLKADEPEPEKDTESITDDFVDENNASFVEYKHADNSVIATSMMSSPTRALEAEDVETNELEKTKEFLNNTLDISPIKVADEVDAVNKSPEVFSEDVDKPGKSILDASMDCQRASPMAKRKLQRARGRSAQLLKMLPNDYGYNMPNHSHEIMMNGVEFADEIDRIHFKNNNFLTFDKELPSPLAKPSSSIMKGAANKRKQAFDVDDGESDSPKSKRKRVSFHDPPVSCEKQYVPDTRNSKLRIPTRVLRKSQKSLMDLFKGPLYPKKNDLEKDFFTTKAEIMKKAQMQTDAARADLEPKPIDDVGDVLSRDDYLIETPTESQGSVEMVPLDTLNNDSPLFADLVGCDHPIAPILGDLTSALWVNQLKKVLEERHIETIGQFAALSELEINRLPLRENKVHNSRAVLIKYSKENVKVEAAEEEPTTSGGQHAEERPINRGVKRKRRFSLSLLEKEREETTFDSKIAQLETIFGSCKDSSEMAKLLKTIVSLIGTEYVEILIEALGDGVNIRHLAKRHQHREHFLCEVFKYAGLNKSMATTIKYAVSIIGADCTYEKCMTNLKAVTGIDFTAADETPIADEQKILNTTEICVKQINTTAETLCEKLTTLIQHATTSDSTSSSPVSVKTAETAGASSGGCDVDTLASIKQTLRGLPKEQFFDLMKDCFSDH